MGEFDSEKTFKSVAILQLRLNRHILVELIFPKILPITFFLNSTVSILCLDGLNITDQVTGKYILILLLTFSFYFAIKMIVIIMRYRLFKRLAKCHPKALERIKSGDVDFGFRVNTTHLSMLNIMMSVYNDSY